MMVRVTVERVTLDTSTSRFVVILKEDEQNRWLPIVVGSSEAQAIALQLENIAPPRPLTHDLIRNLLDTLDARVEHIVVTELKDNTYYAFLGLDLNGEFKNIDARPSDAIALALRAQAPIFVEDSVMQQAGISENIHGEKAKEPIEPLPFSSPEDMLERLNSELLKAVQDERYEEAAKIRDEITKLKTELRQNDA